MEKVYEVIVYFDYENGKSNYLYPTRASAIYHGKNVSKLKGVTDVLLLEWTLDKKNGIYNPGNHETIFTK